MMENDTQNSQQAASTALHNAPKLAKIAQAGVKGGPAGAATEAAVQYCKEILVVAIAVLLLPVLVLLMLPGAVIIVDCRAGLCQRTENCTGQHMQ